MNNLSIESLGLWKWPLGSRYSVMYVDRLAIRVMDEAGSPSPRVLHWVLGVLPSGEHEVAGAWPESVDHEMAWDMVFDELKVRGVERIELIVASDLSERAIRRAYPRARLLSSATAEYEGEVPAPALDQSKELSVGKVRFAARAEAAARDLKGRASLMLARHGAFFESADATDYVVASLLRAQQRIRAGAGSVSLAVLTPAGPPCA